MADTTPVPGSLNPKSEAPKTKPASDEYKVAETREDGTVVLELPDGRMFLASAAEGATHRKHSMVAISHDGLDADGVPTNATIK